jgi:hypothetical protein
LRQIGLEVDFSAADTKGLTGDVVVQVGNEKLHYLYNFVRAGYGAQSNAQLFARVLNPVEGHAVQPIRSHVCGGNANYNDAEEPQFLSQILGKKRR